MGGSNRGFNGCGYEPRDGTVSAGDPASMRRRLERRSWLFWGFDGADSSREVGDLLAKSPCLSSSELSNL
jgi:hypothetical protein